LFVVDVDIFVVVFVVVVVVVLVFFLFLVVFFYIYILCLGLSFKRNPEKWYFIHFLPMFLTETPKHKLYYLNT
jgi:hypothetical protein